jgi:hypothetical protein
MAAKTNDLAAAKARKQKIFLAVAGVLLLAVAAFQVPKLLGGDDSTPAAAPATTTDAATGVTVGTVTAVSGGTAQPGATTSAGKPAAYVAGVGLRAVQSPTKGQAQLATFTLFEAKDPFVQQVDTDTSTGATTPETSTSGGSTAPKPGGTTTTPEPQPAAPTTGGTVPPSSGGATSGGGAPAPAPEPTLAFATVLYNGNPMQVELKKPFPENDPTFVLPAMKKKAVKVGVAGGSLAKGGLANLALGKKLTLVNTATGERFVLKLLYIGSSPEQIATFSTGEQTDSK